MAEHPKSGNPPQNKTIHAEATTTVHKYDSNVYDKPTQGPVLARIHLKERFTGDIEGEGIADGLQAANADGSASLVAMERVAGKIAGREGTFLLQVAATVMNKKMSAEWFVIPSSGTAQLAGLRGQGGFRADLGKSGHATLDYWFE